MLLGVAEDWTLSISISWLGRGSIHFESCHGLVLAEIETQVVSLPLSYARFEMYLDRTDHSDI